MSRGVLLVEGIQGGWPDWGACVRSHRLLDAGQPHQVLSYTQLLIGIYTLPPGSLASADPPSSPGAGHAKGSIQQGLKNNGLWSGTQSLMETFPESQPQHLMAESELGCQEKEFFLGFCLPGSQSWSKVISPFLYLGFLLCVMSKDIHISEFLSSEASMGIQVSPQ